MKWLWRPKRTADVKSAGDGPQAIVIPTDRLRLLLIEHLARIEASIKWLGYSAVSLTMFGTVATGDYSFAEAKLGLDGSQWRLVFIVAGAYTAARAVGGLKERWGKPTLDDLMVEIQSRSESFRESRAIFLIKHRGTNQEFQILAYRDPLWDCYLLPHYNVEGIHPSSADNVALSNFIASFIDIPVESVTVTYVEGCDLRSRKHSEFYRTDTQYIFAFYLVRVHALPSDGERFLDASFTLSGRSCVWLSLSEMEDDENTRRRNLDVTRHIFANAYRLLEKSPDSLPDGASIRSASTS